MRRVAVWSLCWLLLCAQTMAVAQSPMLPGFPPGTFQNRAAHNAAPAGGGTPAFNWIASAANAAGSNTTSTSVGSTNVGVACGTLTAGDVLIIGLYLFSTTTNTVTPPAGWTQIGANQNDGQGMQTLWSHQLGVGETCNYTFSWTTTSFSTWVVYNATGTASATPDTSSVSTSNDGGTGNYATGTITTTSAPDLLVLIMFCGNINATAFTAPGDMTSRLSQITLAGNMIVLVSDAQKATTVSGFSETATNAATFKVATYGLIALH